TDRDRAVAMASLAEALGVHGAAEAESLLERAIELIGSGRENATDRLDMRTILGEMTWLRGDVGRAETIIRQTLAESRESYGDHHPDVALTLMALARALQHAG